MRFNTIAVAAIVAAVILAHSLAPESYSWTQHTISQLAAQGYGAAWIMRAAFAIFGALVCLGALHRARRFPRLRVVETPLILYGAGLIVSALFSAAPFLSGAPFSAEEARLHSLAATTAGVGLSVATLGYGFVDEPRSRRPVHLAAFVGIIGLSALFGALGSWAGLLQRCLWFVGFAWLLYIDRPEEPRPTLES